MKNVIVPAPVALADRGGNRIKDANGVDIPLITMHSFLMDVPCADPRIGSGGVGLRRINKIDRLFADAKAGDEIAVEDSDHAAVLEVLNGVIWGNPGIARQQVAFIDAWEKASDEKRPLRSLDGHVR